MQQCDQRHARRFDLLTCVERRYSAYTTEQLFDLVADVEKYPEFLPWVLAATIQRRERLAVWTRMVMGIGPLQQAFTTRAVFDRPRSIEVECGERPFKRFALRWHFARDAAGGTIVGCSYEVRLRSTLLDLIARAIVDAQVRAVIGAFERRAGRIYAAGAPRS